MFIIWVSTGFILIVHIFVFRSCRVVLIFLFLFVENALDDGRGAKCSFILAPWRRDGNLIQYFREFARVSMPVTAPFDLDMLATTGVPDEEGRF